MSQNKQFGLKRRSSGLMALEQRFMFDGAAADTLHDQWVDAPASEHSVALAADLFVLDASAIDVASTAQLAQQQVRDYLATASANQLFQLFNGGLTSPDATWTERVTSLREAVSNGSFQVNVVAMERASQQTAVAAFAENGPGGQPTVFINATWFGMFDAPDATRALVEELGHAFDAYLNPGVDTQGDEGEAFAATVIDGALVDQQRSSLLTQTDAGTVVVDGVDYEVEFASIKFSNAYKVVLDWDPQDGIENTSERWPSKEQNLHFFDTAGLSVVEIADGSNGTSFSGNDVVAISLDIGGEPLSGWISRPIKANGIVRGFYFWTDVDFTTLQLATADGNRDVDRNAADNRGFVLVVDQDWFDEQIADTKFTKLFTDTSKDVIDGYVTSGATLKLARVTSSSDRVDSALNGVMTPNAPPDAANDALTVAEDSGTTTIVASSGLLANDTDANNDSLTVTGYTIAGVSGTQTIGSAVTITGVGSITIGADGSYSFTPDANYVGPVPPITYTVDDGNGGTSTAVLSINVTPSNDPPTGTNDSVTTPENTPIVLGLNDFGTYTDPENDSLAKIQITQLATHGTLQFWDGSSWTNVTLDQELTPAQILQGHVRFLPDADETGDSYATLRFNVSDGQLYSTSAYTLTVNVTPVNADPTAYADVNTVAEAGCGVSAAPATGNVITGGTADVANGGALSVTRISAYGITSAVGTDSTSSSGGSAIAGLYGTLTIGADGSYSYLLNDSLASIDAMNSGDQKTETFSYTVTDGLGGSASANLTLTINGTNDAPVGVNDFVSFEEGINQSAGNFGTLTVTANGLLANDTDVDNTNGELEVKLVDGDTVPTFTTVGPILASTPITAIDVEVTTAADSVSPPSVVPNSESKADSFEVSTDGGTTWQTAKEIDGGDLKVYYLSSTKNYYFSDNVALFGYAGADFRYVDGDKVARWTVSLSNPVTSAGNSVYTTSADISNIQVGDTVTWDGSTGTITVQAINTTTGEITLDDDSDNSTEFSVSLTNVALTFARSSGVSITAAQEYIEGAYGYLVLNQDGGYKYTLTTNLADSEVVNDTFTYTVIDSADGCTGSATVNIRIYGIDAPTLIDDTLVVTEDAGGHVTFNGAAGVTASDTVKTNDLNGTGSSPVTLGDVLSFTVAGDSTAYSAGNTADIDGVGTLKINADGTIEFDPVDNYVGPVPVVAYTRSGIDGTTFTANLSISIQAVDDASILAPDETTVPEDISAVGNVLTNDSDVDDVLSVASFSYTSNGAMVTYDAGTSSREVRDASNQLIGTFELNGTGRYNFVPAAGWSGSVPVITYTTNTGSTSTLTITVTPGSADPPELDLDLSSSGTGFGTTYTIGGSAVAIGDLDTTVTDADSVNMSSATVALLNPQSGDSLVFDAASILSSYGITVTGDGVSVSAGTVTLSLTGTSSRGNYQAAIQAIAFASTGFSEATRVISAKVDDGGNESNTAYTTIDISPDTRTLTVTGSTVNEASPYVYFQVGGATGQWVALSLGITGSGATHAANGTDFLPNLQYLKGSSWLDYTGGFVQIPSGTTPLLVRTPVLQDSPYEGAETLKLTAYNQAQWASGTGTSGNSTIIDDGTGSIFLPGNNTSTPTASGTSGYPTYLDDDRPVSVDNVVVNEASPWAMFTVTGYANQVLSLQLSDGTATVGDGSPADGTEDFSPTLEYWNGEVWAAYNGTSVTMSGSTLLVRTAVHQDDLFEGQHVFNLGVTKLSSNTTVYGTASIYDDGTGNIYAFDGINDGTPTITSGPGAGFDDDRTLTINSPLVNEGSDYVVFTLEGDSGQTVTLALQDESVNGTVSGKANILENQILKIWDGLSWVDYDSTNLPTFDANGKIFVRVDIVAEQEDPYEGAETFKLNATLTGTSTVVTGVATIIDDGTGVKFPGAFTSGGPTTTTNDLDDDRATDITVTGGNYNEISPRAVFTVNATSGQVLTLDVQNAAQLGKAPTGDNEGKPNDSLDTVDIYYSLDGGATWQLYSGPITAGNVPVLVAVDITNERDDVYEAEEQLKLVVTSGGQTASGYSSIFDDGTGTVTQEITDQTPNNAGANDPTVTKDDDRTISVTGYGPVNEGSPYAMFTVTATPGQSLDLALQDATSGTAATHSGFTYEFSTDGVNWTTYDATHKPTTPSNGKVYVRVDIGSEADALYERAETFALKASFTSNTSVSGAADTTIVDDGTGAKYGPGFDPTNGPTTSTAGLDDDRTISVTGYGPVNEGSPYAMFTVTATPGQSLDLALQDATSGTAATHSGFTYEFSTDGVNWTTYDATHKPTTPSNGKVYVRVDIGSEADALYERAETFALKASFTSNTSVSGAADTTIVDDGTGAKYGPGFDPTNGPTTSTAGLDDDRTISVTGYGPVNEGSPYAMFTVAAAPGQSLDLALQDATSGTAATHSGFTYEFSTDGVNWTTYDATHKPTAPSNGKVYVRVDIGSEADALYERAETFALKASFTSNTSVSGAADTTIVDDGMGAKYGPGFDPTNGPTTSTAGLDDDRPRPVVVLAGPAPLEDTPVRVEAPPTIAPVAPQAQSFAAFLIPADPPIVLGQTLTSDSGYPILVSETAPLGLSLYQGITDQFVQSTTGATEISIPFDAFIHTDKNAVIKLSAKQADDSNLPSWVEFDPAAGTFTVKPPADFKGKLDLKVIARDDNGNEAVSTFQMFIGEPQTNPAERLDSRNSFTEKLRTAGKRPLTLVRVADMPHKVPEGVVVQRVSAG